MSTRSKESYPCGNRTNSRASSRNSVQNSMYYSARRLHQYDTGQETYDNQGSLSVHETCQKQKEHTSQSARSTVTQAIKDFREKHGPRQSHGSNERQSANHIYNNYGLDKSSKHCKHRYEETHESYERPACESPGPETLLDRCDDKKRQSSKTTEYDCYRQTNEANSNIARSALRDGQETIHTFKLRLKTNNSDQLDQREKAHEKHNDVELKLYKTNVVDLLEQKDKTISELYLDNHKIAYEVVKLRAIVKEKDNDIENMRLDYQRNADMVERLQATVKEKDIEIERMRLNNQKNLDMVDKLRATAKEKDHDMQKMRLDHQKNADMVYRFQATLKDKDIDIEQIRLDHRQNAAVVAKLQKTVEERDNEIEKMRLDHETNSLESNVFLTKVKEKEDEILKMRRMNDRVMREYQESERRSKEITKEMAKIMQTKGNFENSDDKTANTQLADAFQGLYDKEWVKLCKWLSRTFNSSTEIKIIETLSKLMTMSYLECLKLAQTQLKEFLLLQETEEEPLQNEHETLFNLRKQYAHTEQMRLYVRKVVSAKTVTMENISAFLFGETGQSAREKIKTFLNEFIDCCWLMIVSKPAMSLNFDVIGKQYGDISEHFTIYSTKKPIEDETKEEGTVYEVVWPCVCMKDGSAFYKKGDVTLVKRGKQYSANQRKCEAATNT